MTRYRSDIVGNYLVHYGSTKKRVSDVSFVCQSYCVTVECHEEDSKGKARVGGVKLELLSIARNGQVPNNETSPWAPTADSRRARSSNLHRCYYRCTLVNMEQAYHFIHDDTLDNRFGQG